MKAASPVPEKEIFTCMHVRMREAASACTAALYSKTVGFAQSRTCEMSQRQVRVSNYLCRYQQRIEPERVGL